MVNGLPIPKNYLQILKYIYFNPNSVAKSIAKALKKNKIYSELRLLNNFRFISTSDYPSKFKITPKGLKELGEQ